MRKATTLLTILASLFFFAFALSAPASADPNGPGNNGTVKIVNEQGDAQNDPDNDPHVCLFHIYGFNFDNSSSGTWHIEAWAPGGGPLTATQSDGTWKADGTGKFTARPETQPLPDGHYKLFVKQTQPTTPGGDKQKVFWVKCSAGATGGTGENGGNGSGGNGPGGNGGTGAGGNTENGGTTTGPNGIVIFTPGNSGSSGVVRGFESAPGSGVGAVSPIVELPGGSNQQSPNGAVNGVETSPVAGVQSLPSTSTNGGPALPLALLGLAMLGLGGAMLRRESQS